jgi:UDP-N-acetylmuramate--alanine ligase
MTGAVLISAGLDPTIVVGGRVRLMGTNARLGKGDLLVAEADEFDRSFLELRPVLAVINNIDLEHLDTYKGLDDLKTAFTAFAKTVPFFGAVILGLDDANVREIRPHISRRVVTFGLTPDADVTARDVRLEQGSSRFIAVCGDKVLGPVEIPMLGLHNVKNALAAIAVSLELEIAFPVAAQALGSFSGVIRRFERKGERDGIVVVDDYAHHPTETAGTLAAARQAFPGRRLAVLFQPHLYSRTRDHAQNFGRAFMAADLLVVMPVYGSREAPLPGVTGALVTDAAIARGHRAAHFVAEREAVLSTLREQLVPGDVLVTMGAGDVCGFGEQFLLEGLAVPETESARGQV